MRFTLTLFLFFALILHAVGQDRTGPSLPATRIDKKFGVNLALSSVNSPVGAFSSLSFVVNQKQHSFLLGPGIWYGSDSPLGLRFKPTEHQRGGLQFAYKFRPNSLYRRVNFYFIYDLSYTTEYQLYWSFLPVDNQNYATEFTEDRRYLANSIGYGFDFVFLDYFYLDNSLGVGLGMEGVTKEQRVEANSALDSKTITSLGDPQPYFFFKIGIGVNIPDFSLFD